MTGIEIRPEQPADREAVERVLIGAFGADQGSETVEVLDDLRGGGLFRAGLVAEVDGVAAGYVALSTAWLDARERLVEVSLLGPLGVLPARQDAGIGSGLLRAAVRTAGEQGRPAVFLEGDPAYYRARGFRPGREIGCVRPSARIPEAAFQVVVLDGWDESLAGALVYPDAWWRRDLVGLRDPLLAEIEARAGDGGPHVELGDEGRPPG